MANDPEKFTLTASELEDVQDIINAADAGRFTLRQLFGKDRWDALGGDGEKREYGARFKQSYQRGQILGVTEDGHKSFSVAYLILGK